MKIVCGVDFSESAVEAAWAAAAIARRLGADLLLVHVIPPMDLALATGEAQEAVHEGIRERVRAHAHQLREHFEIHVEPITEAGSAPHGLITITRQVGARLIVVSSLNARRQHSWLVGSVAERVAQLSPVPVLVVRDAASLQAWARGEKTLRVLVGVDLSSTSRAALKWATDLRAIGPCDLHVTQVAWPFGEHVRLGIPAPIPLDHLRSEIHAILKRDLQAWVGELPGDGETVLTVSPGWGRVDTHLTALAAQIDPDLVVVGPHQRSTLARLWQTSLSRGVLHNTTCNVACVPRSESVAEEQDLPTFRRVLVPTDFSVLANRAIPTGYGLVAGGGVVHLLHVVTHELTEGEPDPKERLGSLIPQCVAAKGVRTELEVVHEEAVAMGIWHAAGRLGVDAICMATHGRSGVAALFMGSQAREVLQRSRQPVVLVPPERAD